MDDHVGIVQREKIAQTHRMVNVQVGKQNVDFPHIGTEEFAQSLYA
jgi:hypothetical protein